MMQFLLLSTLKHCATLTSSVGGGQKLAILIYHRVLDAPDFMRPGEVDKRAFSWQMELLATYFNVLPLDEALTRLQQGDLPPRAVTITFDDGYADNLLNALPILQRHRLTATFFIASGYLNGGRMWNDSIIEAIRLMPQARLDLAGIQLGEFDIATPTQKAEAASAIIKKLKHLDYGQRLAYTKIIAQQVSGLPDDLMLTSEQLIQLHQSGMEIGGHTVTHPILAKLDNEAAYHEIQDNKRSLELILNAPIRYFAYPNGKLGQDYHLEHVKQVKQCGYQAALSTEVAVAGSHDSYWQLPRFMPWDQTPLKFMLRIVRMYGGS
jgi:peptidoglycan/xylan/chitin deacetylase (PgdA/CDA1 family)